MIDFDLNVDFSEKLKILNVRVKNFESQSQNISRIVAMCYYSYWVSLVDNELESSKQDYLRALKIDTGDLRRTSVYLDEGWLANAIEKGANSFDIKDGLLKSSKVKTNSRGEIYITVPFKEKQSLSVDGVSDDDILQMQEEMLDIYNTYRGQNVSVTNFNLQSFANSYTSVRNQVERQVNEQVKNFVNVSNNTGEDSFIHPGIQAKNFFSRTISEVNSDQIIQDIINSFTESLSED